MESAIPLRRSRNLTESEQAFANSIHNEIDIHPASLRMVIIALRNEGQYDQSIAAMHQLIAGINLITTNGLLNSLQNAPLQIQADLATHAAMELHRRKINPPRTSSLKDIFSRPSSKEKEKEKYIEQAHEIITQENNKRGTLFFHPRHTLKNQPH